MNATVNYEICGAPIGSHDFVKLIVAMRHVPSWLLIANFAVAFISRDIYFLICSNFNFFFLKAYFFVLAFAIGVRRPPGFNHVLCEANEFAFPDPVFVTTLSFSLSAVAAFVFDFKLHKYMTKRANTTVILLILGYMASTLLTHYFDAFLLIMNTILAVCFATLFTVIYAAFVRDFNLMASSSTKKLATELAKLLDKDCEVLNVGERKS
jgi:hypothetical protein